MLVSDVSPTIAIVGGGFSGSLVAAHLLKSATRPLVIKLIERRHEMGKGVAYSTNTTSHLLNVSAGKMSAFPDDPGHLLRWLNYNQSELATLLNNDLNASSFIPRQVYGLYVQSILEEAEATASSLVRLERMMDEVIAVEPQTQNAIVSLRSGRVFAADQVVLALGNAPDLLPQAQLDGESSKLRHAWAADGLADLEPDAAVLLVGTGLTMIDVALSLRDRHHRGPIYAVSRRGLAPLAHQSTKPYASFLTPETAAKTICGLVRQIRHEVKIAATQGYDWRSVIDALRPITQKLWQQLPRREQRRFLRHVTPYWDVHRHRIAPEIGDVVQSLKASGQLVTLAGRIQSYQETPDAIVVTLTQRHTQTATVFTVSRVVNCTGVQIDYRKSALPLILNLREQDLIRPNDLGLGLDTAADGAVLDAQGYRSNLLYTLGTPRKGNLWETIAVPELREQAQALATTLLQSLPVRVRPIPTLPRVTAPTRSVEQDCGEPRLTLPPSTLIFRQFFDPESSTYTYLIADHQTREAVLVDTVLEQVERDLQILHELGLTLRYCLETHIHADHITGAGQLRQQTGCQVLVPQNATARSADHSLADREILLIGAVRIEAIATPGHTNSHLAYLINNTHLLTGDALLIRGCGRTDLQSGDAGTLYDTVTQRLFTLPDETLVYPAHETLSTNTEIYESYFAMYI